MRSLYEREFPIREGQPMPALQSIGHDFAGKPCIAVLLNAFLFDTNTFLTPNFIHMVPTAYVEIKCQGKTIGCQNNGVIGFKSQALTKLFSKVRSTEGTITAEMIIYNDCCHLKNESYG